MNKGGAADEPADFLNLVGGYCNDTLGDDDFARLENRLFVDAEARAAFRRYLALDAALHDFGESPAAAWTGGRSSAVASTDVRSETPSSARGVRPVRTRRRVVGGVGACLVGAVILLVLLRNYFDAETGVIGKLEPVTGDVRITAPDGTMRAIEAETPVKTGDTIRTSGTKNSTVMTYLDGTQLTLVGDTSVTFGAENSKSVVVHQGTLGASVRPQPRGAPMLLATPSAQMQVLGTRFLIDAAAHRTDLQVTEGRVRLVRIRDGESVDVTDGKRAVVNEQTRLLVENAPQLPTTWEADFEEGVPEGWDPTTPVTRGLPTGSRGGVTSVQIEDSEDGRQYAIKSPEAWVPGLFDPDEGSHLHFRFKKTGSGWLNVFICTRTADTNEPRFAGNYMFNQFPWHEPNQWYTASIPLAKFERQHRGLDALHRLVPHRLLVVTGKPGMVIDRVWVTPDGSGKFELKRIE
jgi:ferric-dicitrate binding protein FerR (iron transport regulator)